MSSKILKEALIQQKEIQEEAEGRNDNGSNFVFPKEENGQVAVEEEEDIDDFKGFEETNRKSDVFEVNVLFLVYVFAENEKFVAIF